MKALTLHQPWAQLIACGAKTIETRSWATHYRGPLAIHAGAERLHHGKFFMAARSARMAGTLSHEQEQELRQLAVPFGTVVAVVDLTDCLPIVEEETEHPLPALVIEDGGSQLTESWHAPHPVDEMGSRDCTSELPFGDYRVGRYGWMTSPVYAEHGPLPVALPEPVPCRGAQGLWTLPADVEAAVMAQRGEGAAR